MELTIKHLAAYLPYEVRHKDVAIFPGGSCVQTDRRLNPCDIETTFNFDLKVVLDSKVTLILKPMRSLTKNELRQRGFITHVDFLTEEHQSDPKRFPIKNAPYEMVEYLLSQHYDIFGLIEAGLAVEK